MAERRMFAKTIIDSDAFLDMPLSAQALYFHLSMRADDEGFVNNPKKIQKVISATDDDLKLLIAKRFILAFNSGVIVIKHWRIHNYIQSDRFKPTVYQDERKQLTVKGNKAYTLENGETLENEQCIQNGYNLETQVRLGKDSIGKDSIDNINASPPKDKKAPYGEFQNVKLTSDEYEKLKAIDGCDDLIERLSAYKASTGKTYKSDYATILNWHRKDGNENHRNDNSPKGKENGTDEPVDKYAELYFYESGL